jgi:hypothetical protein
MSNGFAMKRAHMATAAEIIFCNHAYHDFIKPASPSAELCHHGFGGGGVFA